MVTTASDMTIAQERCIVLARQLADAMGYVENPNVWMPFSTMVWTDPNEPKRTPVKRHKYLTGTSHRMVVAQKRGIFITHEDYGVWFTLDSTGQWFSHIKGRPNQLEYVLQKLWTREDSEWKDTRGPWMAEVNGMGRMTRSKWVESHGQTPTHSHRESHETTPDSSMSQTSRIVPTFGDLSSREKPSRQKP